MDIFEVIMIAIALSIDACAITIANCTTYKNSLTPKNEWLMPICFGVFQGLMPLIGFFVGSLFLSFISGFTKFLSAGIFLLLSIKIVIDILKDDKCDIDKKCIKPFGITLVIIQAIATSIDALAIGVTMVELTFSIFIAVTVIAVITFILVTLALFFGKTLGKLFGAYAEWIGAGILFILALKSFVEAFI